MHIYNWYHSITTGIHNIHEHNLYVHGAFPLLYYLPLLIPLIPFSNPPSLTWNLPCCDRIRPPWSQVACKLTSPFSTLSPTLPPPNSQNPDYQRLTRTTLRIWHLLSGTVSINRIRKKQHVPSYNFPSYNNLYNNVLVVMSRSSMGNTVYNTVGVSSNLVN
jgi:hypothetical protein